MDWLLWAPLAAALAHIFEEFVWPGGFTEWYRAYRKDSSRVSSRMLFVVNTILLGGCVFYALVAETVWGAPCFLALVALLAANGLWHAYASVKTNTISPGVFTGVLLYVPLSVLAFEIFLRSHRVSIIGAVVAFLVGGSYHAWAALYHRVRSQQVTE